MLTPREDQERSIDHLIAVQKKYGAAMDGSDTGVGKTLVAIETIRRWDEPTLVICPKAVVPGWHRTAAEQGIEVDAINYEMLRTGRSPYGIWNVSKRDRQEHFFYHRGIKRLVFDEVQRCQGRDSKNAQLLRDAKLQGIATLCLSATMAEDPLDMDALGFALGLHDGNLRASVNNPDPFTFKKWASQRGCTFDPSGVTFNKDPKVMAQINREVFPAHGVRTRRDEVPGFPESQISAELYEIDQPGRVDALYAEMADALAALQHRIDSNWGSNEEHPFVKNLRARQEVELLKVPVFCELANEAVSAGMSVAIFVNFRQTLEEIGKRLNTTCFIDGSQSGDAGSLRREANRLAFQNDIARVIVCMGSAGGVGLDLHDVTGKHPRLALISAGYDAKILRQILGRVWRAGGLSKSLQRIIFAAGTVEVPVHYAVSGKLNCLDALNDGDLMPQNLLISARF